MSLFDVIRYPVNDIFDVEEMAAIPEEITVPWAEERRDKLGVDTERRPSKNSPPSSIGIWMRWMIVSHGRTHDYDTMIYVKKHFTHTLRERIKKHDGL